MTSTAPGEAQFHALWPTRFMSVSLPGHEQANPVLAQFVLERDGVSDDMTVQYLNENLFDLSHPAVHWLKSCVMRAVNDYAMAEGLGYQPQFDVQAWANVNRQGDYHNLHNHPHSWLSGTYYVAIPDQGRAARHRSDLNPCSISFFDPRPQANMTAVRGDGQFDPEFRMLPSPGQMFLWPSFLHHLVHPNLVEEPRISISFNVVLTKKVL